MTMSTIINMERIAHVVVMITIMNITMIMMRNTSIITTTITRNTSIIMTTIMRSMSIITITNMRRMSIITTTITRSMSIIMTMTMSIITIMIMRDIIMPMKYLQAGVLRHLRSLQDQISIPRLILLKMRINME